jgi:hypothetical protein
MITFTGVSFFKAITPLVSTVCFQSDKIIIEASVLVAVSTMISFAVIRNKNFFRFEQGHSSVGITIAPLEHQEATQHLQRSTW